MSGRWIDPARLNPYRTQQQQQAQRNRRGPVSEAENKLAWELLGRYLRGGK